MLLKVSSLVLTEGGEAKTLLTEFLCRMLTPGSEDLHNDLEDGPSVCS